MTRSWFCILPAAASALPEAARHAPPRRARAAGVFRLLLVLGAAGAAVGQTEFFPLQVGNQWIYRSPAGIWSAQIVRAEVFGSHEYFLWQSSTGEEAWLRMAEDGTLWQLPPEGRREQVRVEFAAPEGGVFETVADPCNREGVMEKKNTVHRGPVGEFHGALVVRYPAANCADAGLDREVYAPWIGLVYRSGITIAGPRASELIYARLGGVTVLSAPEVAFSLTLDRAVYREPVMLARLTLRHSQPEAIRLLFPSGQTFELVIRDERGNEVYRWSDGKAFTLALRRLEFAAGEFNWPVTVELRSREDKPFPPGRYFAEAWLTTMGPKAFAASAPFEFTPGPDQSGR
jgi:hypothetical protein